MWRMRENRHILFRLSALFVLLFLMPRSSSAAQRSLSPGIVIGVTHVGQDLSHQGIQFRNAHERWQPTAGLSLEWHPFGKKRRRSLLLELLYVQKGSHFDQSVVQGLPGEAGNRDLPTLSVPILAKVGLGGHRGGAYLLVGPSLEILLRDSRDDIYEQFRRTNVGVYFGAGWEHTLSADLRIEAQIRFLQNLLNSFTGSPADYGGLTSAVSRGLFIVSALRF